MHLFQSLVVVALAASSNVAATSDPHLHLRSSSDESNNIVKSEERKLNRNREPKGLFKGKGGSYEVWGSDQSNSVAGETSAGVHGSLLWIWDSDDIQDQLNGGADAKPLSCTPSAAEGPCDLLDIFPGDLTEVGSGAKLEDLDAFGRLHGVLPDPFNLYVTANIFAPTGGYVGVIDTATKEAIALFRVTATDANSAVGRSVHMSFFTADGSAIIIDNLHGKMIERINVTRDKKGKITGLVFDTNAGVYLGKEFSKEADATAFGGDNAFGNSLIGSVAGDYSLADTGNDTPAGKRKEWDCSEVIGEDKKILGGCRPNNVPICPVTSSNNLAYVTLGGGGLFVLKLDETPMRIVGEYGNRIISGAGCGGAEAQGRMFLNGGTSASPAGATQSTFSVYAIDDSGFDANVDSTTTNKENFPFPSQIFNDATNTNTIGNLDGTSTTNESGQLPNLTTRRDSHGAAATLDGKYVHVVDRIQNVVEVFDAITGELANTYDLVSSDGKSGREGPAGPCLMRSVLDDPSLHLNDPAPDLMMLTPDGKHLMIAFRGPKPVTVGHAAQGSCPGVGIVELSKDGKSGKLVDVLRASNTVDTVPVGTIPGGTNYAGVERSDVHGAIVVAKN